MSAIEIKAVPIKYIGGKEIKTDNIGGTGAVWMCGQTIMYPAEKAPTLLRHPDVWEVGDLDDVEGGELVVTQTGELASLPTDKVVTATTEQVPANKAGDPPEGEAKGHGVQGSGLEPKGDGPGAMLE